MTTERPHSSQEYPTFTSPIKGDLAPELMKAAGRLDRLGDEDGAKDTILDAGSRRADHVEVNTTYETARTIHNLIDQIGRYSKHADSRSASLSKSIDSEIGILLSDDPNRTGEHQAPLERIRRQAKELLDVLDTLYEARDRQSTTEHNE